MKKTQVLTREQKDSFKKTIFKQQKPINKLNKKIFKLEQLNKSLQSDIKIINNQKSIEKDFEKAKLRIEEQRAKILELKEAKGEHYKKAKFVLNVEKKNYYKQKSMLSFATSDKQKIYDLIEINNRKIEEYKKQVEPLDLELSKVIEEYEKQTTPKKIPKNDYSFVVKKLSAFYNDKQALYDISISFPKKSVIAIIGPSGCGKSTFLKTLNRINDEVPGFNTVGEVLLDGTHDIFTLKNKKDDDKISITELRTRVGMIFQQPNPFPMSIWKNVTYGPRINAIKNTNTLNKLVETSLRRAALWEEVKDNLNMSGSALSGGQQQRLCIARAIANNPDVLLMDEPTSALDPIASAKIEELILELKKDYTIIMVTHSMQQAARISDHTAFFYQGKLIEFGETKKIFTNPKNQKTDDYIRGRFG